MVSGLGSHVSGLRSQVSGVRSQVSGLGSQVSVLSSQVSGLKVFIGGPALAGLNSSIYTYAGKTLISWDHPQWGNNKNKMLSEQLSNAKRMRLALVSASGMPAATNLSFWPLRALGTSKIGFLCEK